MKKIHILVTILTIFLFSSQVTASTNLITPEELPEEVAIEFGKVVTVEKGKNFRVLIPGRDYIPNNTKSTTSNVTIENTNTSDGYSYLKGNFDNIGQYLIKMQNSYFLFNVIQIDSITTEKVQL